MARGSASITGTSSVVAEKTTMAAAVFSGPRKIDIYTVPWVYIEGMQQAVQVAEQGALSTPDLLTHRYHLEELPLAMRDTEDRPEGFLKGWVSYD